MVGVNDKHQVAAIFCGALTGDFLPLLLVTRGRHYGATHTLSSPLGGTLLTRKSTGQRSRPCCSILSTFFCHKRQVRERLHLGDDEPAVTIIDNFKGQITEMVTSFLETNNVHVCLLPPNTTNLQPMDSVVNKLAKDQLSAHRVPTVVIGACHEAAGRTGRH